MLARELWCVIVPYRLHCAFTGRVFEMEKKHNRDGDLLSLIQKEAILNYTFFTAVILGFLTVIGFFFALKIELNSSHSLLLLNFSLCLLFSDYWFLQIHNILIWALEVLLLRTRFLLQVFKLHCCWGEKFQSCIISG